MISSKQLMDAAGISRATLNNYIAAGLLPVPQVKPAAPGHGRARRLGYFPASALDIIKSVEDMKRKGLAMAEIIQTLKDAPTGAPPAPSAAQLKAAPQLSLQVGSLTLTIEGLDCPAYMVNACFEVEWYNQQAAQLFDGFATGLPAEIGARGLFSRLLRSTRFGPEGRSSLLALHMAIARNKLSKTSLWSDHELSSEERRHLDDLYDAVEPVPMSGIRSIDVPLGAGDATAYRVYASFFREGVLFVYAPLSGDTDTVLSWLGRRDAVIRDVLRKRPPCLTPVAVLIADLQDSVKICAELPPEEYFELINHLWSSQEGLLRKYRATHGKHVGDGTVHYFFPQPDSNYLLNAIRCAREMKQNMLQVSRQWQARKNWLNDLVLNIGIDAGEEWFGTYQTSSYYEFTVLGDTVNRAARLSDLARDGGIWVTKNLISKLSAAERARIRYGIRRGSVAGPQVLVPSTYARIAELCDLGSQSKLNDIATVPATELLDIADTE